MLLLGLDSSHSEGSLCLQRDQEILEEIYWKQEKSHAELIAAFIAKSLKNHKLNPQDITHYAVNVGPGSFTGIRIAINTIKTLSYVTQSPVFAFNSLEVIAKSSSVDSNKLVVAINAHSELCYIGNFVANNKGWSLNSKIEVIKSQELNKILKQPSTTFIGNAFEVYKNNLESDINRPKTYSDIPSAKNLNQLAMIGSSSKIKNWKDLEPFYVRLSSPEEKLFTRP